MEPWGLCLGKVSSTVLWDHSINYVGVWAFGAGQRYMGVSEN